MKLFGSSGNLQVPSLIPTLGLNCYPFNGVLPTRTEEDDWNI